MNKNNSGVREKIFKGEKEESVALKLVNIWQIYFFATINNSEVFELFRPILLLPKNYFQVRVKKARAYPAMHSA